LKGTTGTNDNERLINNTWEKYMFVLRNSPEWFGNIMLLGSNIIQTPDIKWRCYEYVEEDVQKGELEKTGTVERQCRRKIIPLHNGKLYDWKYKIWDYYNHVAIVFSHLGWNNWVTWQVVSDTFKDHTAFNFQVKQFKNTGSGDQENDPSKHWELNAQIHSITFL